VNKRSGLVWSCICHCKCGAVSSERGGASISIRGERPWQGRLVIHTMTLAQRWTISNMGVEVGAKFAIFKCDDKLDAWLQGRLDRSYTPVFANAEKRHQLRAAHRN
jgi:hypothetical protein